jgi:cytidylate kinase
MNTMNRPYVINIGRQLGSGGREIGHILSQQLGIAYYDKEILSLAARESGFCTEIFERNDERKGFFRTVFNSIAPMMGGSNGDFYSNQISDENLFRIQSDAIRKAANETSCIFIGRCADYILRDHPRCVNIFISADREDRIRRICENLKVDPSAAEKMMEQGDSQRAEFYNFYSSRRWGAANTYHLCINSSVLGIEGTATLIRQFVEKKIFGIECP